MFADSMQLVSNCYNLGLITVKSILLRRKTLKFIQRPLYSLGNDSSSRIEINSTIVSLSHATIITGVYSNHVKAFVQFVGRPQLKNGNLWLKTGSCSASSESGAKSQIPYCSYQHHVTLQCPAYFLHFLQTENIGSPDGDPITLF